MGQDEIVKQLKKYEWLTVKELSQLTKIGKTSVSCAVKRLYDRGELLRKIVKLNDYNNHVTLKYKLKDYEP